MSKNEQSTFTLSAWRENFVQTRDAVIALAFESFYKAIEVTLTPRPIRFDTRSRDHWPAQISSESLISRSVPCHTCTPVAAPLFASIHFYRRLL
jgi:hypothetical protein